MSHFGCQRKRDQGAKKLGSRRLYFLWVGSSALPVPYPYGWLYLDLNKLVPLAEANPPIDPLAAQAWVTVSLRNNPLGTGGDAVRFDSACAARHSGLP